MTLPTKLRARVSPEAITKVTRIFNGTLDDVFNELFQNARRAGATMVAVTAEHLEDGCQITVTDDGLGIADPEALVSLGQSDWSDTCRAREDPAGMGFFSLAGLDTVVRSVSGTCAFSLAIAGDAWTGEAEWLAGTGLVAPAWRSALHHRATASSSGASRQPHAISHCR